METSPAKVFAKAYGMQCFRNGYYEAYAEQDHRTVPGLVWIWLYLRISIGVDWDSLRIFLSLTIQKSAVFLKYRYTGERHDV